MTWFLTGAEVLYTCGACGKLFKRVCDPEKPGDLNVPVAAKCPCGGFVGLDRVYYHTGGDEAPAIVDADHANPTVQSTTHLNDNVTQADIEAADELGIELESQGGSNESTEDNDLQWN